MGSLKVDVLPGVGIIVHLTPQPVFIFDEAYQQRSAETQGGLSCSLHTEVQFPTSQVGPSYASSDCDCSRRLYVRLLLHTTPRRHKHHDVRLRSLRPVLLHQ